ncbi:MAG: hypothetical protein ACRDLF_09520, partial [Solirubrobacteraceae bacterium]
MPKASARKFVFTVGEEPERLPWEGGHPLGEAWIGDKQAWQHFVYMGVYPLEAAFAELREALADT